MGGANNNDTPKGSSSEAEELTKKRYELLQRIDNWLEIPMLVLAFVWLALLVSELIWGEKQLFVTTALVIWGIFILNFGVEFT